MRRFLGGLAGLAVLGGIGVTYKLVFAKDLGEVCSDSNECKGFSGECLEDETGSYCTATCAANTECPGGWTCTTAQQQGGQYAGQTSVCARPFAGAPAGPIGGVAMPMTGLPGSGMPMTAFPMTALPATAQ